jgi:hypothetical protein
MARIFCAFPGTGKTHFTRHYTGEGLVLDSDSTNYSWLNTHANERVRNPDFPANYIRHISTCVGAAAIILVSSHPKVKTGLLDAGLDFTLVYPKRDLKSEYMGRYERRGSPPRFLEYMDENWDILISRDEAQQGCPKIIMESGQYLSDVL